MPCCSSTIVRDGGLGGCSQRARSPAEDAPEAVEEAEAAGSVREEEQAEPANDEVCTALRWALSCAAFVLLPSITSLLLSFLS